MNSEDAKDEENEGAEPKDVGEHGDALEEQNNQEAQLRKLCNSPKRPHHTEGTQGAEVARALAVAREKVEHTEDDNEEVKPVPRVLQVGEGANDETIRHNLGSALNHEADVEKLHRENASTFSAMPALGRINARIFRTYLAGRGMEGVVSLRWGMHLMLRALKCSLKLG